MILTGKIQSTILFQNLNFCDVKKQDVLLFNDNRSCLTQAGSVEAINYLS